MNSNSDLMSSMSEVSVYTDPNIPTASADSKFNYLGVNRFYSPNMARRRSYVFEQVQPCGSSDVTRRYVGSPDTTGLRTMWSPMNWLYGESSGAAAGGKFEGNTFPRRSKMLGGNVADRNLFSSSLLLQQYGKPSDVDKPEHQQQQLQKLQQQQHHQQQHLQSQQQQQQHPQVKMNTYTPPLLPKKVTETLPKNEETETMNLSDPLLNGADGGPTNAMSLDTKRLLTGNLPDVALAAAKAIHKRELSDSMPKFRVSKDAAVSQKESVSSVHVAGGLEEKNANNNANNNTKNCSDSKNSDDKNDKNHKRKKKYPKEESVTDTKNSFIRDKKKTGDENETKSRSSTKGKKKVKAFSWPKKAVLPSYKDFVKGGGSSTRKGTTDATTHRPESGYNTEKSEEKLEDAVFTDDLEVIIILVWIEVVTSLVDILVSVHITFQNFSDFVEHLSSRTVRGLI